MTKYGLKRLFILLLVPFTLIVSLVVPGNPEFVESFFSRGIYKVVSVFMNRLTGYLKISISSIIYPLAVIIFIFALISFIRKYRKAKKEKTDTPSAYKFFINIFIVVGLLFFLYIFTFSLNYYRIPFVDQIGLEVSQTEVGVLYEVTQDIAENANFYRMTMKQSDESVSQLTRDFHGTGRAAQNALKNLALEYPILEGDYSPPKPVAYSSLMSLAGITGVFAPLTFEANINTGAPDYTIPATMCHELAHLRGFMSEDEANFIAYLACIKSNDMELKYSGAMMALTYCLNSLYSSDQDKYYQIKDSLSHQVKNDLEYSVMYWAKYQGGLSDLSEAVNDAYLKANNQSDGIQSYGMVVDLIIAYHISSGS